MLADFVRANARRITIDEIQKLTAQHFQTDQSELRSKRRARAVVRPLRIAMYLPKKMTPRSLPEHRTIFGDRHHSTISDDRRVGDDRVSTCSSRWSANKKKK